MAQANGEAILLRKVVEPICTADLTLEVLGLGHTSDELVHRAPIRSTTAGDFMLPNIATHTRTHPQMTERTTHQVQERHERTSGIVQIL